jgi:hypothetical protein
VRRRRRGRSVGNAITADSSTHEVAAKRPPTKAEADEHNAEPATTDVPSPPKSGLEPFAVNLPPRNCAQNQQFIHSSTVSSIF